MELKPVEVWYWKIRGKGTVVTDFLSALNVPFTLHSFEGMTAYPEFKMKVAKEYPFVNLPMIRDPNHGNKYLAETNSILQYLAQTYKADTGFKSLDEYPEFMTISGAIADTFMGVLTKHIFSSKTKEELKENVMASRARFGMKMSNFMNSLKASDWLFGNRFTYLDVIFGFFTEWLTTMETELGFEFLTNSEREIFLKHMKRVQQVEGIKKWRQSEGFFTRPFSPASMTVWY